MTNPEEDLILLEMSSRLTRLEELLAEMANTLHLLVPVVATLQEHEKQRWVDGQNG